MSRLVVTALRVVCLAYLTAMPPQGGNVRAPDDLAEGAAAIIDGNVRGAGAFAQEAAIIGGNVRGAGAFAQEAAIIGVATKSNQSDITAIKVGLDGGSPAEFKAEVGNIKLYESRLEAEEFSTAPWFTGTTLFIGRNEYATTKPVPITSLHSKRVGPAAFNRARALIPENANFFAYIYISAETTNEDGLKFGGFLYLLVDEQTSTIEAINAISFTRGTHVFEFGDPRKVRLEDKLEHGYAEFEGGAIGHLPEYAWIDPGHEPLKENEIGGFAYKKSFAKGKVITLLLPLKKIKLGEDAEAKKPPVEVKKTSNFWIYVNEKVKPGDMNPEEAYPTLKNVALGPERDVKLIELYSQSTLIIKHYWLMNKALRDDDPDQLSKYGRIIYEIMSVFRADKMINLNPTESSNGHAKFLEAFDGMVVRGMAIPVSVALQYVEESVHTWEAFSSTSTDPSVADKFSTDAPKPDTTTTHIDQPVEQNVAVVFDIKCNPQLYNQINDHADFSKFYVPSLISSYSLATEESEVVFPPYSKFRVTARWKQRTLDGKGWFFRVSMEVAELPSVRKMVVDEKWAEVKAYMQAQTQTIKQSVGDRSAAEDVNNAVINWMTGAQDRSEIKDPRGKPITDYTDNDDVTNAIKSQLGPSSLAQSEGAPDCMTTLSNTDWKSHDASQCIATLDIMQLVVKRIATLEIISDPAIEVIQSAQNIGIDIGSDEQAIANKITDEKIKQEFTEKAASARSIREKRRAKNQRLTNEKQATEKSEQEFRDCGEKNTWVLIQTCCSDSFEKDLEKQKGCKDYWATQEPKFKAWQKFSKNNAKVGGTV